MLTLKFTSDPGHSWLRVHKNILVGFTPNVVNEISRYSFQSKNFVYLEEDADATRFINELKARGIEYTIEHKSVEKTHIRNYARYNAADLPSM